MAATTRRIPGYVIVLVLVVAGLLAAVPVFVLRPSAPLGPPLLLVRAMDTIRATPADATVPADFGPKCSPFAWDERRSLLTVEADVNLAEADGLLLQRFVLATQNFRGNESGFVRPLVVAAGSGWRLMSPVDGRALSEFARAGDAVASGGQTYGPGSSWAFRFAYNVTTSGGTVLVEEQIEFRNDGVVRPHIVPTGVCV